MPLLLIEDEVKLAHTLQKGLTENGYEVDVAYNAETGLQLASEGTYSLIISDVILPGASGIELLKQIRQLGNTTPVLLLTALGQLDDKEAGFDAGADDYLTKPFEFRELLLRIRALHRRPQIQPAKDSHVLRYAQLEINLDTKEFFRNSQLIPLTPKEFDLMEYFIRNPERVLSKTEISEKVWDLHFDTGTNVVEVYVNFLRKKVDKDFEQKMIHTQFKIGYMLRAEHAD
jgi:two-component system, OmpR family, copper resistance phosphate regulon response regulator CusR